MPGETKRGRRWLLVTLLLLSACAADKNRCAEKTLLVSVSLEAAILTADTLQIDISVDGGTPVRTTLAHKAGQSVGSVEVDFPSGYPRGKPVLFMVTAESAGATVGQGSVTVMLAGTCEAAALTVSGGTANLDIGIGAADQSLPPDDSGATDDAAANDAAVISTPDGAPSVDLNGSDLRPSMDMTPPCVPVHENCFNHVDDDCDGKVDCDDPDCVGGLGPPAVCVPDPQAFTVGVTLTGNTSCPAEWPTATPINSDLYYSCTTDNCGGCNTPRDVCGVQLAPFASAGCASSSFYTVTTTCNTFPFQIPSTNYHSLGSAWWTGDCGAPSGTSAKVTPTWNNTESFCSGGLVGGGCAAGSICVPAGPNHCVMTDGSEFTTACPANYVKRSIDYYTGFNDSARACSCGCNFFAGVCTGTATVQLHLSSDCASDVGTNFPAACSNDNLEAFQYAIVSGGTLSLMTGVVCGGLYGSSNGPPVQNGEKTVCCTP